jgi:hypothetical protein
MSIAVSVREAVLKVFCPRQAAPTTEYGKAMKVTVPIDVPSIEAGLQFFGEVFGFVETARPQVSAKC